MGLCTKACVRAHHYAPACFTSLRCSGYSICQANLNDLVGSEMCHKGALMDEREHGANDTATSRRQRFRLMKALALETAFERRHIARARQHQTSVDDFLKAWPTHAPRQASRYCEIHKSGSEQFKKMSAFGDLMGRMSNGLADTLAILFMHLQVSGLVL